MKQKIALALAASGLVGAAFWAWFAWSVRQFPIQERPPWEVR